MARFCTRCGAVAEGRSFCTQCGAAQPSPQAAVQDEAASAVAGPAWVATPGNVAAVGPAPAGRSRRAMWLPMTLVLLLALGGVGGVAWWATREPVAVRDTAGAAATPQAPLAAMTDAATGTPSPSATSEDALTSSPSVEPTAEATTSAPTTGTRDPLGLGVPLVNMGCTGEYVVVLASSGTPRAYVSTLAPTVAVPAARYLTTQDSCSSFVQQIDGRRIYASYIGPFPDLLSACSALEAAGVTGSYARWLDAGVESRSVCACRPEVARPRVSRILDQEVVNSMRARAVSDAQVLLARAGYNDQNAFGGVFGELTDSWVRDFQRDVGLRATGVITPSTWQALLQWCDVQDL